MAERRIRRRFRRTTNIGPLRYEGRHVGFWKQLDTGYFEVAVDAATQDIDANTETRTENVLKEGDIPFWGSRNDAYVQQSGLL